MKNHTEDSEFICHEPCTHCGSSDAGARYTDGHFHCFSCKAYEPGTEAVSGVDTVERNRSNRSGNRLGNLLTGEIKALVKRGLTEDTCRKYGYLVGQSSKGTVQIAEYRNAAGEMAQHCRTPDKDFFWVNPLKAPMLFGQHLFNAGRRVTIAEGEIDCLTVSQVQDNKWPVVSLPNGAPAAKRDISNNIQWLLGFDEIVLMFDMDEAGQKAAAECAALFPPGRCKIAHLPEKDPNACLLAGVGQAIIKAIYEAKPWRPDGVVRLSELKEAIKAPAQMGLPWCFEGLTGLTYGRRYGETIMLGAGTGIGKTDVITQQVAYDLDVLNQRVGVFLLEQSVVETGKRVAGKLAAKRFHIPDAGWTQDELDSVLDKLIASDNLFLYDNFGQTDWDVIKTTIRFLNKSEGVRIFYLDHLTALAAGQDDERVFLENTMSELAMLAKELDIIMITVSHLTTPEGKPHEEGGRVTIRQFKGSRAIGFWSSVMIGLERNTQADDPEERMTTVLRILKMRPDGSKVGEVVTALYDTDTGVLAEGGSALL